MFLFSLGRDALVEVVQDLMIRCWLRDNHGNRQQRGCTTCSYRMQVETKIFVLFFFLAHVLCKCGSFCFDTFLFAEDGVDIYFQFERSPCCR